ncbi:MAG TPA: hypothetical protein PKO15_12215 [Fibrobacteria bacterium]|nr:hypothetical protein [Fibrobacteria bacterium]HOX50850.1 hypothetical protein [Fibrobacteria bacterium]
MSQEPLSSGGPDRLDPYRSSQAGPGDLGPIPGPPPPIWWILPGSLFCLFAGSTLVGVLTIPFGESVAIPALVGWAGLLVWSIWVTASRRSGAVSIYGRSYLLANALVALLVGVIGTTCSGMTFGASSGDSAEPFLWILLCVVAISVVLFAFRWPRES